MMASDVGQVEERDRQSKQTVAKAIPYSIMNALSLTMIDTSVDMSGTWHMHLTTHMAHLTYQLSYRYNAGKE